MVEAALNRIKVEQKLLILLRLSINFTHGHSLLGSKRFNGVRPKNETYEKLATLLYRAVSRLLHLVLSQRQYVCSQNFQWLL